MMVYRPLHFSVATLLSALSRRIMSPRATFTYTVRRLHERGGGGRKEFNEKRNDSIVFKILSSTSRDFETEARIRWKADKTILTKSPKMFT